MDYPVERFFVPINYFKDYKPIHLLFHCRGAEEYIQGTKLYMSLTMESELESFVDSLCTVAINMVDFDPKPMRCSYFNLILATDGYLPHDNPY